MSQRTSRSAPVPATRTSGEHTPASSHYVPNLVGNTRRKLVIKIFAGPVWEGRLLKFVGLFMKRRKEFGLALTLHTLAAVDAVVLKLGVVDERTAELSQKYDVLLYSHCV